MSKIDLHVHSNKSDGTLRPAEVVQRATVLGLSAIALTDHDCTSGLAEAEAEAAKLTAAGTPFRVVPGVEISADYQKRDIHILGLLINPENSKLQSALDAAQFSRDARNEKMVHNLQQAGIDITTEALHFDAGDTVITRAHFARFLLEHGYVKNRREAFTKYLDSTTPYYVCREYMQPKEAIHMILDAGGIPVLAHPLLYHLSSEQIHNLVSTLKKYGLCGIETFYSANNGNDEAFVRQLAARYDLVSTGGSDFHGANKPDIELGSGRGNLNLPMELLTALEAKKKELF